MKILFVQKEGGIFGAENYQLKVIPGLLSKGVEIEFLRLYTNHQGGVGGEFINRLQSMGVKTHEVNIGRFPSLSVLRKIHRVIKNGSYDLVHTHLIHADFHVILAKKIFGGKYLVVSTKHGYDNSFTSKHGFDASKQTSTMYFLISRWAEKRMQKSFTISHGLRDFFIGTGLTNADRMELIHYGFDMPEHFKRKGETNLRVAEKQLIIAGRLVAFKGHELLLKAMAIVKNRSDSNVKLIIAGTGDLEEHLKEVTARLDIKDVVDFIGYSKDVGGYMANSDLVVIPSISEGFGVVFLEAFASKTPVVSWDVPAGNELMEDGITGYTVKPYDVELLAKRILDVFDNDQSDLVEAAHQRLLTYFNLDRMVSETLEFYKRRLN